MSTIRLSKSTLAAEEKAAVMDVLDTEFLGMGAEVQAFEQEIKEFIGTTKEVVCVNTGTAALQLAVQACGVGVGDEVLVPSHTYVASYQAISATGAKPVSCEVRDDNLFIDIEDARRRLTERTRAIMPVHYASDSQHMDGVYELARECGLRVIEDAAHSFACSRNGHNIGVEGDIVCFSFDGIKNITAGEGGAVLSADPVVIQKVQDARLLGVEKDTEKRYANGRSWDFNVTEQGYRYHMSNIMAAIGRAQLRKVDGFKAIRQKLVRRYREAFQGHPHIRMLELDWDHIMAHIFVIRVSSAKRDALRSAMADRNIQTGIHYFPNHLLSKYATNEALPITEAAHQEMLTLPLQLDLTQTQQDQVIETVLTLMATDELDVSSYAKASA